MKACLLLIPILALPAFADTYPRQPGVDAQHYTFRLTLRDDTDEITGEATADLLFLKEGVSEVALDLISASGGKGMTVSEVTSGGAPVRYTHAADRLVIALPSPAKSGERRQFTVKYHGVPKAFNPGAGLRIDTNRYAERTFFSLNWPNRARQWLPIIDHPYDKATSEFLITAPAKYTVVANGRLVEETELGDGNRLTHWKQSVPIASWLNAIGVAQFATRHFGTVAGVPLETWVFHQDRDAGIATFEVPTRQALEFFIDDIGPYPYEKLADVQAPGLGGGTEHASAIFYGQTSVTDRPATNLVTHEIAHQWFGDSITERDWDDVWLSEGFATYFTLLATEHYEGRDAFVAGLKRSRDTVFRVEKQLPGSAVIHNNLSDMSLVLNQLVYQKGGWFLHMLRSQVGTERFWTGIRDYYHRYRDSSASTADFRKVMEENSGMDLGWLFDQWLRRPGSPVVDATWRYDAAAKKVALQLTQTQPGEAYRLPLEIGVATPGTAPPKIEKIVMTGKQQSFEIAAESQPSAVVLDPNTWVLMTAQISAAK